VRTEVDGVVFASRREARRYAELKLLEQAGEIVALELQPQFALWAHPFPFVGEPWSPVPVAKYIADFRYYNRDGELVIEDVKGMKTPLYRLKKKITEVQYGIQIREI
jgi:hypothetical protein